MSEKLLPCPFCGGEAVWREFDERHSREPYGLIADHKPDCFLSLHTNMDEIKQQWNTRAAMQADAAPVAWIVGNGNGDRWRAWKNGNPVWVGDREKATRYARREDAEAVHEDDEDAWRIVSYQPVDNRVSTSSPVDVSETPETSVKLRDAVEVWEDAYRAWDDAPTNPDRIGDEDRAAAAVIEADREAVRAEQAAELAKWREKYDGLGNDALKKIGEMGARIGRLDVELDAAKADLQGANRELAKWKALAETLAGALEKIATSKYDGLEVHRVSARQCHRIAAEALRKWEETRDAS